MDSITPPLTSAVKQSIRDVIISRIVASARRQRLKWLRGITLPSQEPVFEHQLADALSEFGIGCEFAAFELLKQRAEQLTRKRVPNLKLYVGDILDADFRCECIKDDPIHFAWLDLMDTARPDIELAMRDIAGRTSREQILFTTVSRRQRWHREYTANTLISNFTSASGWTKLGCTALDSIRYRGGTAGHGMPMHTFGFKLAKVG